MGGDRTISGSISNEFDNVWTLQIEINSALTNKEENYHRYKKLLDVLVDWIKNV